jgi:DnaJ family protein C protein 3
VKITILHLADQSPADYVLYYKRATAYFSLSRHPSAISDFDKVIGLTSNSFDKAHLMKARMYAKDGYWTEAKDSLKMYTDKVGRGDNAATELLGSVKDAEAATKKTAQAQRAKLWTACEEASSAALTVASHSIEIRQMRAECSLAAGDLEMAIGDLT